MGGPVGISDVQLHSIVEHSQNVEQALRVEQKRESNSSRGESWHGRCARASRNSLIGRPGSKTAEGDQWISHRRNLPRERPFLREHHDFSCVPVPAGNHDPPGQIAEVNFVCPHCGSFYEVLRARARPSSVSCVVTCSACKGPLPTHDGPFRLEYFLWRKASVGWHRIHSTPRRKYLSTSLPSRPTSGPRQTGQLISRSIVSGPASTFTT
jgi:hypothetical protein